MDASHNDLEAIRRVLAELTTRVYQIEHKLEIDSELVAPSPANVSSQPSTSR